MKQVDGEKLLASLGPGVNDINGRLTPDAPMDRVTWFQAGGLAELMFQPHDVEDLTSFLK
ncbi:MAG: UDP-N-acetylenolpyruvoylglucosamine reductase, partial [Pseudomonadota bacterium]|nr:UDP-N-acetylenolpyruvoylglucosamine reductase [Pseudomonadota bacterium]